MGRLLILSLFFFSFLGTAHAITASWQKNTEPDMKDYGVYACFVKGCTVAKSAAMLQGYVPHAGAATFPLPANSEGGVAISARDTAGNESGVTVTVPFDSLAPLVPALPILQ